MKNVLDSVALRRLANQHIGGGDMSALAIVKWMGAMQSQEYQGALWSIGVRTGLARAEVIRALEKHEIVRTWPQRGTLHMVAANDAQWQVALSEARMVRGVQGRHVRLGLNDKILAKAKMILTKALAGGKSLSRAAIFALLEKSGINTKNGSGYHILWYLSQTGVLIAGPAEEKQQTFALLETWVKKHAAYTREASIKELAKRYFTSHGPATIQDFMWWSGLTSVDAKAGLEANKATLTSEVIGEKTYWSPKAQPAAIKQRAFLLSGFDEYMLGYKDRSAALPLKYTNHIVPGGNGMFLATIVIDGQVVGTWKKEIKKDRVRIRLQPFGKLSKAELALLKVPAVQYGYFLGLTSELI